MILGGPAVALPVCLPLSNFGGEFTILPNVIQCDDGSGNTVTVTGPGEGFQILQEGSGWLGEFAPGTFLLYDNGIPGPVTIDFSSPVTPTGPLTGFAAQANLSGPYSATVDAYLAGVLVGTNTYNGDNNFTENTIPSFFFSVPGSFDELIFSTTNDSVGFALGPVFASVPEPLSLSLFGAAILGLAALRRRLKPVL